MSKEQEAAQRELFWYREELLKSVKADWREVRTWFLYDELGVNGVFQVNGSRFGQLNLRKQRFSQSMLQVLRMEPVRVDLSLQNPEGEAGATGPVQASGRLETEFHCVPYTFVSLKAEVQNLSRKPFLFLLVRILTGRTQNLRKCLR